VIKNFRFSIETIRFLNSLSNLLTGGVPILLAFKLSLQNFSSTNLRNQLTDVSMSLKKGESLGQSIKRLDIFPDIIPNMITIGEESGKLPDVLNELYNFLSERYLRKIKKFMNLLEPLIIMFIAVFIGFIVLSIIPIIVNISDINF
jgi:type IV pilus assembly protein PilC